MIWASQKRRTPHSIYRRWINPATLLCMVTAVLNEMQRQSSVNGFLLEDIRQVIREELQEVSFVAASPVFERAQPELTEEQQAENDKSVLDDLKMFG